MSNHRIEPIDRYRVLDEEPTDGIILIMNKIDELIEVINVILASLPEEDAK